MEKAIFCGAWRVVLRREAKRRTSVAAASRSASLLCQKRRRAARGYEQESGHDAGFHSVSHGHEFGTLQCSDSSTCNEIAGLRTRHVGHRNADLRHLVTLTLQGRNAKNIFTEKIPSQLIIFCDFARNVGEGASIFRENTSVSCAVHSSIDRLMFNSNRTSFSYVPTVTGGSARVTTHNQGNLLRRTAGGAL